MMQRKTQCGLFFHFLDMTWIETTKNIVGPHCKVRVMLFPVFKPNKRLEFKPLFFGPRGVSFWEEN